MDRLPYQIHGYRQPLWFRLPKHPTIAGYFWIAYFVVIGVLVLGRTRRKRSFADPGERPAVPRS